MTTRSTSGAEALAAFLATADPAAPVPVVRRFGEA